MEVRLDDLSALTALDEPVRADLYFFLRGARRPVTREEAAAAVGVSRGLAAFHLEKMLDLGLLIATRAQPPGRSRPGRSPKLYAIADRELAVSIPGRRYDFLGDVILDAIEDGPDGDRWREKLIAAARRRGWRAGEEIREDKRLGRVGPERALTAANEFLEQQGYEPERTEALKIVLRNCPFQPMAGRSPAVVCGMNQGYLDGLLRGIGNDQVQAFLRPGTDRCCVELAVS